MTQLREQANLRTPAATFPETLTIRWAIGGEPEPERTLTLRLDLAREKFEASLGDETVCAGVFDHVDDHEHAMVHFDCEGVFNATVAWNGSDAARLLYARTALLTRLGIPGGRADAPTLIVPALTESPRQATRAS